MEGKDLKDQLEGLFSGLVESPATPIDSERQPEQPQVADSSSEKKQPIPSPTIPNLNMAMSESTKAKSFCPYLGLADDRSSRFSYPEVAHCCFAADQERLIALDHQSAFCLTNQYRTCSRFVEPSVQMVASKTPLPDTSEAKLLQPEGASWRRTIVWGLIGLLAGLLMISSLLFYRNLISQQKATAELVNQMIHISPLASPTLAELAFVPTATLTPIPVALLATPTPTATPVPGSKVYTLSPAAADIGWVRSDEDRGNHFGDSFLYAGIFEGQIYQGAFQFNLRTIPRGAPIHSASIQLTGLREDRLAVYNDLSDVAGVWSLRLLAQEVDPDWNKVNYQDLFNASVLQTLNPILSGRDLATGRTNRFELSPEQIKIVEQRIIDDEEPKISFRMEGPVVGPDNLFAWDTGYGAESRGNKVSLILNVGQPPATPPSYKYVVVTSTPTPESVTTALAIILQITADATRIGTATPVPANMVTATPIPDYLIITATPLPENPATVQALIAQATYQALTTGTPLPLPTDAVTATPTPSATPLPTYVLITETPTSESVFAAATLAAAATAQAQKFGIPTPLPPNWVTPFVVTSTPTPANAATAEAMSSLATAIAFTTGTPTPTPNNMVTATSTPIYESIPYIFFPTPTPPLTSTVRSIPSILLGKILFQSDREEVLDQDQSLDQDVAACNDLVWDGNANRWRDAQGRFVDPPQVYVFDPNTGELGRLTDAWPYQIAHDRDAYSADTIYQAYTKQLLWTNVEKQITGSNPTEKDRFQREATEELAIHIYDFKYGQEKIVTRMGAGIVYDPAWSPVNNQIAFVATESGNEEIWVINYDGAEPRQLTHNTWEWDKSPSWSPDGQQLVFMSNRTGNQQIWIMNADGTDQRLLMGWDNWTPYNDCGPVWVKYLDPPPPPDQPR